jgi:hypothetical protein
VSDDERAEPTHAARKSVAMPGGAHDSPSQSALEAHVSDDQLTSGVVCGGSTDGRSLGVAVVHSFGCRRPMLKRAGLESEICMAKSPSSRSSFWFVDGDGVISGSDVIEGPQSCVFSGDVAQWWLDEEGADIGDYFNSYRRILPRQVSTDLKWCGRPVQNLRAAEIGLHTRRGGCVKRPPIDGRAGRSEGTASRRCVCSHPQVNDVRVGRVTLPLTCCDRLRDGSLPLSVLPPRERLRACLLRQHDGLTVADDGGVRLSWRDADKDCPAGVAWRSAARPHSAADAHDALAYLRNGTSEAAVLSQKRSTRFSPAPSHPATASGSGGAERRTMLPLCLSQSKTAGSTRDKK